MVTKTLKFILLFAVSANSFTMNLSTENPPPHNSLVSSQCTARCMLNSTKVTVCRESCVNETSTLKLGSCPDMDDNGFDFMENLRNCTNTCHEDDFNCPDDSKCCKVGACSYDCRKADFGEYTKGFSDMPPLPDNIYVDVKPSSAIVLYWTVAPGGLPVPYVFNVESRNHIGPKLNSSAFSEFRLHKYAPVSRFSGNFGVQFGGELRLKAGRYYQFRVAAVNFKGTRGYGYSMPFILDRDPKPPNPPQDVKFGAWTSYDQKTVSKMINWTPAKSELPVDKYKIIWMLKSGNKFVQGWKALVENDRFYYEIRGLKTNSTYLVKVHTQTRYGTKIMKSFAVTGELKTPENFANIQQSQDASEQPKPQKIKKLPDPKPVSGVKTKLTKEKRALQRKIQRQRKRHNLKIEV